jgi:DNA polymerase-4
MRWVIHVDMDAYFASVETLVNPSLRGKPIIVGGVPGTRSTVSTASYEARKFGIKSGMAIAEAYRLCPQGVFLPGSSALYLHTSKRIFDLLGSFSPRVEPASVDEAYVEIEAADPQAEGRRIQAQIATTVQLSASLGISDSKYLAKVASSFEKPGGLTFLPRSAVREMLWPRPVSVLHGVGAKTESRLAALGYATVGDLGRAPEGALERSLGALGGALRRWSTGNDARRVTPPEEAADAKSISHEYTLEDLYDRSKVEAMACILRRAGRRARRHGSGRRVLLLRDKRFETITQAFFPKRSIDGDITRIGHELLAETRFWERGVRLPGVSLYAVPVNAGGSWPSISIPRRPCRCP